MGGYYSEEDDFIYEKNIPNLVGEGLDIYNPFACVGENYNTGTKRLIQCMEDILSTLVGSRFFMPSYGSLVPTLKFEQNDYIAVELAEIYTKEAIELWEPRVVLLNVIATAKTGGVLSIEIQFKQKSGTSVESFVYSFNRDVPEMG